MKPVLKLWDHPILLSISENHVKIENRPKQGKKGQIAFAFFVIFFTSKTIASVTLKLLLES